jgi:hypothetical protein
MKRVLTIMVAVLLIAVSVMPAFAESVDSPTPTKANYQITIVQAEGGTASYSFVTPVGEVGKQTVHFSAKVDDGYTFAGWTFEGNYSLLGNASDTELDVVVGSDLKVVPAYTKNGGDTKKTDDTSKTTDNSKKDTTVDTSSKSPKTGSSEFVYVAIASVALLGLVFVAKKSFKK